MGQGAHFAHRTAGAGLTGQRKRTVAGGGNLTRQQMNIVDEIVDPGAPGVLIHAHAPEGGDLLVRIPVKSGHVLDVLGGHTGYFFYFLRRVILQEGLVLFKINGFCFICELKMVFGTVADIGFALMKGDMFVRQNPN